VKAFVDRHPELAGKIVIPKLSGRLKPPARMSSAAPANICSPFRTRENLPAHRPGQGRGEFHHRSFDGRNRQPANTAGTAHHSCRARRRKDSRPDHRPKFTGRFNKGVDYAGDLKQFEQEFNDDLAVIAFASSNTACLPRSSSASIPAVTSFPFTRRFAGH